MENNYIELKISSQGLIKNGWKLIKKLRDNDYNYYAVIECLNCGFLKTVPYYNFIYSNKPRVCANCSNLIIDNIIGKTFGSTKVLSFYKQVKDKYNHTLLYFNTECIKCHHKSIKLYNISLWLKSNSCKHCNKVFEDSSLNDLLRIYKQGARDRNINWNLTNDDFKSLVLLNCYYCGNYPNYRNHDRSINKIPVNGIDRINSLGNYDKNNCVPCCTMCNYMKLSLTKDLFLAHISKIYNYFINQGSTTIENTNDLVSLLSTLQVNGNGNGGLLNVLNKEDDIV